MSSDVSTLLLTAPPSSLFATAQSMAKKDARDRHWSRLAIIIGRIEDEQLYTQLNYASTRAYATEELQLSTAEFYESLAFWRMMRTDPRIRPEEWAELKRSYAVLVKSVVLGVKGDAAAWLAIAKACATTEDLRRKVNERLDKETWGVFKVSGPILTIDLAEEALRRALPEALDDESPDPALLEQRGPRAKALEVMVRHFIGTYRREGVNA